MTLPHYCCDGPVCVSDLCTHCVPTAYRPASRARRPWSAPSAGEQPAGRSRSGIRVGWNRLGASARRWGLGSAKRVRVSRLMTGHTWGVYIALVGGISGDQGSDREAAEAR